MTWSAKKTAIGGILLLLIAACTSGDPPAQGMAESGPDAAAPPDVSVYRAAVDNPARSEADRERDAGRRPAEVLEFFGVRPGMTVLDLFSGGGYYTEIVSHLVGDDGRVVAQTNAAYQQFVGDEATNRYAGDRLPNVEILVAENNELDLPPAEFDAILMILSYHDIYFENPDNGWPKIDGPKLLAELHEGLKPGGVLGIVDHYAEAGSPRDTGNTTHRIDPQIVIDELEAAGFELDDRSDMLRSTADDYSKIVFDPEVRGKTDRFVLRFVK